MASRRAVLVMMSTLAVLVGVALIAIALGLGWGPSHSGADHGCVNLPEGGGHLISCRVQPSDRPPTALGLGGVGALGLGLVLGALAAFLPAQRAVHQSGQS